jgi:hypothetical protein
MRSSSIGLRLMMERLSICSDVIVPSRAPVSVRMIARSAVTVTVSLCWPTSRATSRPRVSLALTLIALKARVLNPEIAALSE